MQKIREIRKAFSKCLLEYFKTSNLHGYPEFVNGDTFWIRRLVCIWLPIFATCYGIYLVVFEYNFLISHPMITTLISNQYPAYNFPFPAVAICPNNKISKTAAWEYAQVLHNRSNGARPVEFIFEKLKYLGHLIDSQDPVPSDAVWLQELIDTYEVPGATGWTDMRDLMSRLQPKCDKIVLKCMYEEAEFDCMKWFVRRQIIEGFCCTFNYLRKTDDYETNPKLMFPKLTGIGKGLSVVLNASTTDYHFPLFTNDGFNVHIYYPHDYPDPSAGLIIKRFVAPLMDSFIQLRVIIVKALDSVKFFTEYQRGCRFPEDDYAKEYNNFYVYSDCLVKCQIRSLVTLCGCIPFYLPRSFNDPIMKTSPMCNLNHLQCLDKYRIKIRVYRPKVSSLKGLEKELEDSVDCPECLPLCSYVRYGVDQTDSFISPNPRHRQSDGLLQGYVNVTDVSIVNVYFASSDSILYHQTVRNTWYGLLSNVGGNMGLCIGFSLVAVLEFLYHVTFRVYREMSPLEKMEVSDRISYKDMEKILNKKLRF